MTRNRNENQERGSFRFTFRPKPGQDPSALAEAVQSCFQPGVDAYVTIRGEFSFGEAGRLSELADESELYYEPAPDSIVPPLLPETVDEALELILKLQEEQSPRYYWETIPEDEMTQTTLHAVYRMVAAEWVVPDDFRQDIAVPAVPERARTKKLRDMLRPWGLSPAKLFRRTG